jgi:hypothetical protein
MLILEGRFHCLFCHGFEERGVASAGLLAVGDCAAKGPAMHLSRMAGRLAKSVTVYTDGTSELSQTLEGPLKAAGYKLNTKRIVKLVKEPNGTEVTIHLEDGSTKTEGFMVGVSSLLYTTPSHPFSSPTHPLSF